MQPFQQSRAGVLGDAFLPARFFGDAGIGGRVEVHTHTGRIGQGTWSRHERERHSQHRSDGHVGQHGQPRFGGVVEQVRLLRHLPCGVDAQPFPQPGSSLFHLECLTVLPRLRAHERFRLDSGFTLQIADHLVDDARTDCLDGGAGRRVRKHMVGLHPPHQVRQRRMCNDRGGNDRSRATAPDLAQRAQTRRRPMHPLRLDIRHHHQQTRRPREGTQRHEPKLISHSPTVAKQPSPRQPKYPHAWHAPFPRTAPLGHRQAHPDPNLPDTEARDI